MDVEAVTLITVTFNDYCACVYTSIVEVVILVGSCCLLFYDLDKAFKL